MGKDCIVFVHVLTTEDSLLVKETELYKSHLLILCRLLLVIARFLADTTSEWLPNYAQKVSGKS